MRLKGIMLPSHREQGPGRGRENGLRPGRRYPIVLAKAAELEESLNGSMRDGEKIDIGRMTRYISGEMWHVWTTLGRRIEVGVTAEGQIIDALISESADPDLPPCAR